MQQSIPRIAAIHALPSFGRSSLSVIIPVLSAMGVQVCPIPTAVLSSHTGGLGDVKRRELDSYITDCLEHYKELELEFNCIYSGYFSSEKQIDDCIRFFEKWPKSLKIVDPVMGDHGKPYRFFTGSLIKKMNELVSHADVITPNLTEASLILGTEYNNLPLTSQQAKTLLLKLSEKGPSMVVVTGVMLADGNIYNIMYSKDRSAFFKIKCDYVPVSYPGTGDIYASILVGALSLEKSLPIAADMATSFCELAIKSTYSYGSDKRYGVCFEPYLDFLSGYKAKGSYELL